MPRGRKPRDGTPEEIIGEVLKECIIAAKRRRESLKNNGFRSGVAEIVQAWAAKRDPNFLLAYLGNRMHTMIEIETPREEGIAEAFSLIYDEIQRALDSTYG